MECRIPGKCKISALSRWMKLGFPAHGRPVPQLLRSARKQRERTTTTQWKVHKQLNPFMIHQHSRGTGFQSVYLQTKEGGTNPNPSSASPGLPLARWCRRQAMKVVTASMIPSAINKEQHGRQTGLLSCPSLALTASKLVGCFPYTQQPRLTGNTRVFIGEPGNYWDELHLR